MFVLNEYTSSYKDQKWKCGFCAETSDRSYVRQVHPISQRTLKRSTSPV